MILILLIAHARITSSGEHQLARLDYHSLDSFLVMPHSERPQNEGRELRHRSGATQQRTRSVM